VSYERSFDGMARDVLEALAKRLAEENEQLRPLHRLGIELRDAARALVEKTEASCSSMVNARDLTIRDLQARVSAAELRADEAEAQRDAFETDRRGPRRARPMMTERERLAATALSDASRKLIRACKAALKEVGGRNIMGDLCNPKLVAQLREAIAAGEAAGSCTTIAVLSDPVARRAYLENRDARVREEAASWGVWVVDGPSADTWCQHTDGLRIEVDERTAKTIELLFTERFEYRFKYEARSLR
jgi:hypothetical protein